MVLGKQCWAMSDHLDQCIVCYSLEASHLFGAMGSCKRQLSLSWGMQPQNTMWASMGPTDRIFFSKCPKDLSDFVLQPPKSGATLRRIFFGFWSPKSDKKSKALRAGLEKLVMGGDLANQTFPWGCAFWQSLITLRTSLGNFFQDSPFLLTVCKGYWTLVWKSA